MFFDCLYDEDVISEDAFYKWESSKDPAEQEGKGVALKSVTAFFTWLREAEEESEDNWRGRRRSRTASLEAERAFKVASRQEKRCFLWYGSEAILSLDSSSGSTKYLYHT